MDIGLLYQEYRRERKRSTGHHHSARRQQSGHKQQQQEQQSTAQSSFLRGIGRAVPSLLAPSTRCSPGSRPTSASLPPSASDHPWPAAASSALLGQSSEPKQLAQQQPPSMVTVGEPAEFASPTGRVSPVAAKRRTTTASAAAEQSPAVPPGSVTPGDPGTAIGAVSRAVSGQGHTAPSSLNNGGRWDGHQKQLVAIDPKDVKSVLSQVVAATMRDLLGRDQEARERNLLRQIRRTLGDFESSMASIVKSFAACRQQPDGHHRPGIVNNSAGNQSCGAGVASVGLGVCGSDTEGAETGVGVGCAVVSSRDSGQSIRESCCPSEDRATSGTRVPLGDSESDYLMPMRCRQLSNLSCPNCKCTAGNRSREQKNFNHRSSSDSDRISSSDSNSSDECSSHRQDETVVTELHLRGTKFHKRKFPKFPADNSQFTGQAGMLQRAMTAKCLQLPM